MLVTEQSIHDGMNGVAMILDHGLRIARVGGQNWRQFPDANSPSDHDDYDRTEQDAPGRPVTQFFAGDVVQATFAALFQSLLSGDRPVTCERIASSTTDCPLYLGEYPVKSTCVNSETENV